MQAHLHNLFAETSHIKVLIELVAHIRLSDNMFQLLLNVLMRLYIDRVQVLFLLFEYKLVR